MADQDTFSSLDKLAQQVQDKIKILKNGRLKLDELNELLSAIQEIHERTIILRYRAMLDSVSSKKQKGSGSFQLEEGGISENQTSLIDAIEELGQEEAQALLDKVEERAHPEDVGTEQERALEKPLDPQPSARPLFVPQPEAVEEVVEEEETESEPVAKEEVPPKAQASPAIPSEEPTSVAEKLTRSPIASIKASIGLNQKFRFINELFDGDAERYAQVIDQLDNAASSTEALALFDTLKVRAHHGPLG